MNSKKMLALFVSFALMFSFFAVSASASFADTETHWAKDAIERFSSTGIVVGDEQGNFNPDNPMTRAEFAVVLDRIMDYQTLAENSFSDVESN